jgi:hypothetical protein
MNLSEYIADPARRDALAAACNTSSDYLWQVATGWRNRRPGPQLARTIERETERMGPERVPKEALRPDLWGDDQEAA